MHAISFNQIRSYLPWGHIQQEPQAQKNTLQKVKDIAFPLIKELGMLAISLGVVITFASPTSLPTMLAIVISCAVVNLALRYYEKTKKQDDACKSISESTRALLFSSMQGMYLSTFAHEYGHVFAAEHLYNIKNIGVTLFADGSGVTRYSYNGLSDIGNYFGKDISRGLVSASGTLVEVVLAISFIITAIKIFKKHPYLAKTLLIQSFLMILRGISYALSSLASRASEMPGHDFISVAQNLNIHPIVSAVLIIGVPLLIVLISAICSKSFRKDLVNIGKSIGAFMDKLDRKITPQKKVEKQNSRFSEKQKQFFYFLYLSTQCYIFRSNPYYLVPIWMLEKTFLKKNILDYFLDAKRSIVG